MFGELILVYMGDKKNFCGILYIVWGIDYLCNMGKEKIILPSKSGWYWVLIKGCKKPTPCWYMGPEVFSSYEEGDECFLPGGMGDSSSSGLYVEDIFKVGPEIMEPEM